MTSIPAAVAALSGWPNMTSAQSAVVGGVSRTSVLTRVAPLRAATIQ